MICENLSDLDIIYNKNPLKIDSVYGEAGGTYTTIGENKNDINLYRQPEYSLCLKKTLFHEINHSLTMYYPVSENLFAYEKNYLGEMANELVTYEYYDKISSNNLGEPNSLAYSLQMPIMYPLCEILDIETIKKFKYDNKVAYITEDLSKLDSDITKSYELITAINLIDLYEQNLYKASSKQDSKSFKQAKEEKKKNQEKIYNLIKYYYEKNTTKIWQKIK